MAAVYDPEKERVVHEHHESSNGGMGFLLGIIILVVFLILFFVYLLPLIRSAVTPAAPQVNVPPKVDVNIKQQK